MRVKSYGIPWDTTRGKVINFVLIGSVILVYWQWDRLSWQARGLILAAYGVFILVFFLPPAFRIRERRTSGAQAQGSVVGAVQETNDEGDSFYHAQVRFFMPDGRAVEFTSTVGYGREPDVGTPGAGPLPSRRSPAGRRGQRRHLATACSA